MGDQKEDRSMERQRGEERTSRTGSNSEPAQVKGDKVEAAYENGPDSATLILPYNPVADINDMMQGRKDVDPEKNLSKGEDGVLVSSGYNTEGVWVFRFTDGYKVSVAAKMRGEDAPVVEARLIDENHGLADAIDQTGERGDEHTPHLDGTYEFEPERPDGPLADIDTLRFIIETK